MKSNFFLLVIAMLVFGAASAFAGPIISVDPAIPTGPINCSDSVTYTVHYNPNDYTGDLFGYSIDLTNSGSDYVTFGTGDVVFGAWPEGPGTFVTSIGTNALRVDVTPLGADALAAGEEADLFTITVHGADTGTGLLNLAINSLTRSNGNSITPNAITNPMGTITVDCDAPAIPMMVAEPVFTGGTSNKVFWGTVTDPSGPVEYNVRADDGSSTMESGWIFATDFTFTGLTHGVTYSYDVQSRDALGNTSAFSGTVSSTQDDVTPESAVGALASAYGTWTISIPWTGSDDLSGLAHVQLMYQVDGGGYVPYGTTYTTSPINFVATMDGDYDFYTVAVDVANNVEQTPEADAQSTTLDTTPPVAPTMVSEPLFTPGTENTVEWGALADAVEYEARINGGTTSGWINALDFTFTGLTHGAAYTYDVRARDALGNVGPWSAPVETSTQDDVAPVSSVTMPASGNLPTLNFPVTVTATDATSGVGLVRLYYNLNGGGWVQFGSGFAPGTPIPFVSPGDGLLDVYSVAEDAVGNLEVAPVTPDQSYLIDTMGPTGTFAINGGDTYTTSQIVDINCPMTDPNGVILMRFRVDGGTWSAWMAYADPHVGLNLGAGDGTRVVDGEFQDGTGNVSAYTDDIDLDTMPPPAVTGFNLTAGHEIIGMTWTETDPTGDLAVIEIWASLYDDVHDAVGNSVYPEFNDEGIWPAPGNPGGMPTVAVDLAPDADWYLLESVPAGEMTYDHIEASPWAQAGYSYYAFAKDNAGNYSPAQSQWSAKAVNYILGDFDGDGTIAIGADVSPFAAVYGTHPPYGDPANIFDIGPVGGGIPSTDDYIGFDDLMILSLNFNAQSKAAVGEPEMPVLTWYPADENTWVLGLVDPTNCLKGVHLASTLPTNVSADVRLAEGLGSGFFVGNDRAKGLNAGFAVLGHNSVFPGQGEILRVETSEPVDLSGIAFEVRDFQNEPIEFELQSEPLVLLPSVYSIENNYPNPFNPETTIKFALPEAQDVRLEIFNIRGQRVRTLVSEGMAAGHHTVIWNGTDQGGRNVASGTYFYRIQAGPLNETHRMMLVK